MPDKMMAGKKTIESSSRNSATAALCQAQLNLQIHSSIQTSNSEPQFVLIFKSPLIWSISAAIAPDRFENTDYLHSLLSLKASAF